jgi:tripartite-type tricarboxylate transporter receptor subunit TctC
MLVRLPFRLLATAVGLAATSMVIPTDNGGAQSQAPNTVRTVVPYAPGGVADVIARLVAQEIGRTGGPTLIVENRPGAGGAVGTEAVARATPDGNTILVVSTPFIIDPLLRKLNYDPLTSFAPLCYLVNAPTVIVVNSATPYHTLAQLLDDARAKPGLMTMASIGPASSFQLGFEMLKRAAKVDMTFVPYPGNAPALDAVLGQQVTSMFGTYSNVAEYLKAGKLRALAVGDASRAGPLPDVPTLAEAGYRDIDADAWFGAFAPARVSEQITYALDGLLIAALKDPAVKEKLGIQGLYPVGTCGVDFAAYLKKQHDQYIRIIAEANMKAE